MAFTTLHDLVNELHASLADGSLAGKLQALSRPHILIIDEVGYLPLDKERANYFQIVSLSLLRKALKHNCFNAFAT